MWCSRPSYTEMSTPVQYPQRSFAKAPAPTRPISLYVMPPLEPGAVIDLEEALPLLFAHLNETPLVAAAGGAAGPSSKECAKPVKCTTRQYTSRQENANQIRVGHTRHWTKEEFGWSFVDCDSAKPVKCTTRQYTSLQEYANEVRVGYTRHWTKEKLGWSFIDWIHSE